MGEKVFSKNLPFAPFAPCSKLGEIRSSFGRQGTLGKLFLPCFCPLRPVCPRCCCFIDDLYTSEQPAGNELLCDYSEGCRSRQWAVRVRGCPDLVGGGITQITVQITPLSWTPRMSRQTIGAGFKPGLVDCVADQTDTGSTRLGQSARVRLANDKCPWLLRSLWDYPHVRTPPPSESWGFGFHQSLAIYPP